MFHSLKRFWLAVVLVFCGRQSLFAFALLGPFNEPFQVPTIGYHLVPPASAFGNDGGGVDLGAPKNFGQGYRRNTPTNYYAYDATFLRYFGAAGVTAVDQAFAHFNNLTNVSKINIDDWPSQSSRVNFRAQALQLLDLKSYTMSLLIEQLGLAQPDRWTWALHDRFPIPGAQCPAIEYFIIQRNFDPTTTLYSTFVNGVLYDYQIDELCPLTVNPFAPLLADAVEFPVDPAQQAESGSAVAAFGSGNPGKFFIGFTRDDVGGLKYLYSPTNAYVETAETNSFQLVTNSTVTTLTTSNLALFSAQALTNDAATLTALYPGLIITATSNFFTLVVSTNVTAFLTNPPFAPAGTLKLVLVTNLTTNVQQLFFHTFANVVTNHFFPTETITTQTTSFGPVPFAPAGTFRIITNSSTTTVKFPSGDFYIVPANLCGGFDILPPNGQFPFAQQVFATNAIPVFTNAFVTNVGNTTLSASFITSFTQYTYLVRTVDCGTNTVALREGMDTIRFVRQDFDSLLGQAWAPITNFYHLTAITNGIPIVQTFRRLVTQPDILISAADLANGPAGPLADSAAVRTTPRFNASQVAANQGGPGTIDPGGVDLTFNSVGPIFYNLQPSFSLGNIAVDFAQTNSVFIFQWGSFDGTTNEPVVYPSTASIASLEAELFFQVTTSELPNASVSANTGANPYSFQLQASGGSLPITWSLDSNSAGLPLGLTLSSGGVISGVPTTPGIFDFTVQATANGGGVAKRNLFIVINL